MDHGGPYRSGYSDYSASSSLAKNSVFSQASESTNITRVPLPTFEQYVADRPSPRPTWALPCEFAGPMRCREVFSADQVDDWIQHHLNHLDKLGKGIPGRLRCLLCDDFEFDCRVTKRDEADNFWLRMEHTAGHLNSGDFRLPFRTDFWMIQYIESDGGTKVAFDGRAVRNELSAESRRPVAGGARPIGYVSEYRKYQDDKQVHDQKGEDRQRNRQRPRRSTKQCLLSSG